MTGYDYQRRYESWWLNKRCRLAFHHLTPFMLVTKVKLVGPPSFVYGSVWLTFEDGSECFVPCGNAFKPRKCDVEVQPDYDAAKTPVTAGKISTMRRKP